MPGIVGLITKLPRVTAEQQLLAMVKCLRHEPFYNCGTWSDEEHGIYVGWVARRGSFADGMPVRNEDGEIALFFSGEEFPDPDLKKTLRQRGHQFSNEPSSYLVHRYEDEATFPKDLNGRFHGLVADRRQGTTTLFNDRYGLQRLHYHECKDAFYFAAESKAILKVRPELRATDPRGVGEFVACGCVLENRTLFPEIYLLPPGSAWVFRNGELQVRASYFEPKEWEQQEALKPEEYYSHLRDAFVGDLPRYFDGQEQIGVSLTGGLDTRIIMAWHKAAPNSLPCYTFGSMYRDHEDVKLARGVARICEQSHQVITAGTEFLSQFAHYAERTIWLTDACVDLSRSPDLYVNERVREIAPVRMVGTYGSEILQQAVMFKATEPAAGVFEPLSAEISAGIETYNAALEGHPVSFVAFRQSPWHHFGVLGLEQTQVAIRSPYLDNDFVKTVYRAPGPSTVAVNSQARVQLILDGNPALAKFRTDRGIRGLNSIFTRSLLEFFFKAEYAYDMGMPQWMAQIDHLLAPLHLERIWLGRHKPFHFRVWYRDQLHEYVRQILLDKHALERPYVSRAGVERIVNGHLRGNRNYTTEIHRLLSLELAHRLFVEAV
ncbi:MAG: asparagine synthase-related protein [Terriglobales bacterium]|jgi:asparagine synthase (glutamine-hydrolysing)